MEYGRFINGEHVTVYDLEDCLRAIRCRNEDNEDLIKRLRDENDRLKSEAYKDNELKRMADELENAKHCLARSFTISDKESIAIAKWKKNHEKVAHGFVQGKLTKSRCFGGSYTYCFVPTGLGTTGVVRCSCGAEFEFQHIG